MVFCVECKHYSNGRCYLLVDTRKVGSSKPVKEYNYCSLGTKKAPK